MELAKYIYYLINKWNVFIPGVEINECNSICEVEKVFEFMNNMNNNNNDNNNNTSEKRDCAEGIEKFTEEFVDVFMCFEVLDVNFEKRLTKMDVTKTYDLYKQYKQNEKEKHESSVTKIDIKHDTSYDTSDTWYSMSLDDVTTEQLQGVFGEFQCTGSADDKYRYEYKCEFIFNGKAYVFSIYDYKNDDDEWYDTNEIYWHVASNTSNKRITSAFEKNLMDRIFAFENNNCC